MRAVAFASVVLLLACAPTPDGAGDVRLNVEPESLSAGDSITLELSNGSAEAVGYNLCTSGLERLSGGEWQAVPSDRVCTMELRTLPGGERVRYELDLPSDLPAGEYRYRTRVERLDAGEGRMLRSGTFRVEG